MHFDKTFFLFNPLGNGYCRSEAAVAVLLTKKSMAKRIYATVLNAGNNTDGYKEQGKLILPSHRRQICFKSSSMSEFSSVNTSYSLWKPGITIKAGTTCVVKS